MLINILYRKVSNALMKRFASPIRYARHIGVQIGKNCLIVTKNWSSEPYLVKIGNNVQITNDVYIHTHGGAHSVRQFHPDFDVFGKVVIEDWVYIGAGAQVMPGVTIGEGALVAAGSIVTKSVEPHTVVGGNPARYICTIDEYYQKNKKYNLSCKSLGKEDKKHFLLNQNNSAFLIK